MQLQLKIIIVMKKEIILILILISIISCTDRGERPLVEYKMFVKNETNHPFTLKITSGTNEVFNQTIQVNNSIVICKGKSDTPIGNFICGLASMELKFPNGKGYRCSNLENSNTNLCFDNDRNLMGQIGYADIGNTSFEFKITQDDYSNAYTLP